MTWKEEKHTLMCQPYPASPSASPSTSVTGPPAGPEIRRQNLNLTLPTDLLKILLDSVGLGLRWRWQLLRGHFELVSLRPRRQKKGFINNL